MHGINNNNQCLEFRGGGGGGGGGQTRKKQLVTLNVLIALSDIDMSVSVLGEKFIIVKSSAPPP